MQCSNVLKNDKVMKIYNKNSRIKIKNQKYKTVNITQYYIDLHFKTFLVNSTVAFKNEENLK